MQLNWIRKKLKKLKKLKREPKKRNWNKVWENIQNTCPICGKLVTRRQSWISTEYMGFLGYENRKTHLHCIHKDRKHRLKEKKLREKQFRERKHFEAELEYLLRPNYSFDSRATREILIRCAIKSYNLRELSNIILKAVDVMDIPFNMSNRIKKIVIKLVNLKILSKNKKRYTLTKTGIETIICHPYLD